jgi:hypothetical protein
MSDRGILTSVQYFEIAVGAATVAYLIATGQGAHSGWSVSYVNRADFWPPALGCT